jgi:hypothetical protein
MDQRSSPPSASFMGIRSHHGSLETSASSKVSYEHFSMFQSVNDDHLVKGPTAQRFFWFRSTCKFCCDVFRTLSAPDFVFYSGNPSTTARLLSCECVRGVVLWETDMPLALLLSGVVDLHSLGSTTKGCGG